ncbi:MAG: hypothetical protein WDN25_11405 [Acetobacteraceae bacterium]
MRLTALTCLLMAPATATLAAGGSAWNASFNNGITEYLTGTWDAAKGGALNLSCRDGRLMIMTQIDGKEPPPNSVLRLTTSSRTGSHEAQFATGQRGSVEAPVAGSAEVARLWSNLRRDDIVTVRYADGRSSVLSLDGATRTLPVRPCG